MPCMWSMSLWHRPTASTRSTAPPGGGSGTGSSRTSQGPSPGITTALLIRVIRPLFRCLEPGLAEHRVGRGHPAADNRCVAFAVAERADQLELQWSGVSGVFDVAQDPGERQVALGERHPAARRRVVGAAHGADGGVV